MDLNVFLILDFYEKNCFSSQLLIVQFAHSMYHIIQLILGLYMRAKFILNTIIVNRRCNESIFRPSDREHLS